MSVDLILYNCSILQMTYEGIIKGTLIIKDGKIIDITHSDTINDYLGIDAQVIDLKGKVALPGFIDSHTHLMPTSINKLGVDLSQVSSIGDILDLIKERQRRVNKKDIIWGVGLDELQLDEKRLPTKAELDTITPNQPVFINRLEYHTIVVNSYVLHKLNLPFNISHIEKNSTGVPTGHLHHHASFIARRKMYEMIPESELIKGLQVILQSALSKGVTSLVTMEGGTLFHDSHAEFLLREKKRSPMDIEVFYQTTNIDKVLQHQQGRIGGCIFIDGSFGSRSAALYEPYADAPDTYGNLYFTQEEINDFILGAHKHQLQITVHAIGGRAIEQILNAYELALETYPTQNHRHRIEHFELPTQDQINRAKQMNIILSMQPAYEYYFANPQGMYDIRLGKKVANRANPFRKLIDSGLILAGGSDSDITPIDPLLGVHSAVNHPVKSSRITPYEALKMFTINGAIGLFQESIKGTLEKGKLADIVILDQNPITLEPELIKDINVLYTIKDGRIVYQSPDAQGGIIL